MGGHHDETRRNSGKSRRHSCKSTRAAGIALVAAAALAFTGACAAQMGPIQDLASFPRASLEIRSARGNHAFDVWVAETPERQAQGLMFVRDLPASQGMLFVYPGERDVGMWMKNTFIELDMLFIAADGRILHIVERTRPHSLATISSPRPAKAVLELRGGEARRRGLRPGDRVIHPAFR
jgi:uncharacterized membrane protein (UPF0127 family)